MKTIVNIATILAFSSLNTLHAAEPVKVFASKVKGDNLAENTTDGDLSTRWAAKGEGEYIQYKFAEPTTLEAVNIAFFKGDKRSLSFQIESTETPWSAEPNWQTHLVAASDKTTDELQSYKLSEPVTATYFRVVGFGFEGNWGWSGDLFSINEIEFVDAITSGVEPVITGVSDGGSGHASYPVTNVVDGDTSHASRWASNGSPSELTVQLEAVSSVTEVGIAWGRGDQRTYTFDVFGRSSEDGLWVKVYEGVSSGSTTDVEPYTFSTAYAQELQIRTYENSGGSEWTDITEITVNGMGMPIPEYRTSWVLDASHNTAELALAIDESSETRWSTKATQFNGQWLSVDLGTSQTFNTIQFETDASPNDYARGYLIYASDDGINWEAPVALEEGSSDKNTITFDDVTARYVKIVQTGLSDSKWWSIHELHITQETIPALDKDANVDTLAELQVAITKSDQTIVMKAGDYDLSDLDSGNRELLFSGSNNTIDLEGVYINVPVGSTDRATYFVVSGSNNTITGGELEDTYTSGLTKVTDFVSYNETSDLSYGLKGAAVISVTGNSNLLDGIKLTVRGSFPYGYGSLFGIGAPNTFGLNKRCGILVNGVSNTIENSQVIQQAFCHGIYIQSPADDTTIRNTYVQGAVRESNDMLAEGTGSLPEQNDYLDNDGNAIEANEVHSLSEDGLRVYNGGGSVVVENSTVYKMRGGIRLYLASNASVSNSISLDSGNTNYNMPKNGTVTNSVANFTYAPVSDFRLSKSNQNLEITIEPSPNAIGAHNIADVLGNSHNITFHRASGPEDTDETRQIVVSGNNSTILNETEYDIVLEAGTSGNTVTSAGTVIDNGENTVIKIDLVL